MKTKRVVSTMTWLLTWIVYCLLKAAITLDLSFCSCYENPFTSHALCAFALYILNDVYFLLCILKGTKRLLTIGFVIQCLYCAYCILLIWWVYAEMTNSQFAIVVILQAVLTVRLYCGLSKYPSTDSRTPDCGHVREHLEEPAMIPFRRHDDIEGRS